MSPTPILFLFSYCIFVALWMPMDSRLLKPNHALGGECPSLSVVGQRLEVKSDWKRWSCDDRKGYSSEDQHFLSIFSKWNSNFAISGVWVQQYEELQAIYGLNRAITLGHKCPIPISPLCLLQTSYLSHGKHWCASQCWWSPIRHTKSCRIHTDPLFLMRFVNLSLVTFMLPF